VETEALTQRISCIGPYAVHPSNGRKFQILAVLPRRHRTTTCLGGPAAARKVKRTGRKWAGGQVAGGTAGGLNILGCWACRGLFLSRTAGADANHGKIRSSDRAGRAGAASRVIVIGCNGLRSARDSSAAARPGSNLLQRTPPARRGCITFPCPSRSSLPLLPSKSRHPTAPSG